MLTLIHSITLDPLYVPLLQPGKGAALFTRCNNGVASLMRLSLIQTLAWSGAAGASPARPESGRLHQYENWTWSFNPGCARPWIA